MPSTLHTFVAKSVASAAVTLPSSSAFVLHSETIPISCSALKNAPMVVFFHLLPVCMLNILFITPSLIQSIMLILIYVKFDITDHKILWFRRAHLGPYLVFWQAYFFLK